MKVQLNGEVQELAEGMTLSALVASLSLAPGRLAAEVNGAIVPRSDYGGKVISEGDVVEIVQMIGGG